jgi:hypothetical protein
MTGPDSRTLAAPGDGSLGPVLRISDDRLAAGAGYGLHAHRAVDVVAVVLAGALRHRWGAGAVLRAGDVAVLRAGTGLEHDELAEDGGARVLQTYLRSADPSGPPRHDVVRAAAGWVDLGRPDARLWIGRTGPEETAQVPAGYRVEPPDADGTVLVWEVDGGRPAWAIDDT